MSIASATFSTRASPETCWSLLADFEKIDFFNPHLERSFLLHPVDSAGVGTLRQCDLKNGGFIRERVLDWREGEFYEVEVFEHRLPVRDLRTRLSVTRSSDGGSILKMQASYVPRFGILGRTADAILLRPAMERAFGGVLAGLAVRAEAREQALQSAA